MYVGWSTKIFEGITMLKNLLFVSLISLFPISQSIAAGEPYPSSGLPKPQNASEITPAHIAHVVVGLNSVTCTDFPTNLKIVTCQLIKEKVARDGVCIPTRDNPFCDHGVTNTLLRSRGAYD